MGWSHRLAWSAYQLAHLSFLLPAVPFYALRRGGRGFGHWGFGHWGFGQYGPTLKGRATLGLGPADGRSRLWIHAVSVGEAGVAATLARDLPPDLPLVVTTVTPTGQAHAERLFSAKAFADRDVEIAYLPFDLGPAVDRFLRRFQPRALILTEGDYWPLMLSKLRRLDIPVLVANGRVSERAFGRQRRLGKVNRLFYGPVVCFAVQTEQDRARLIELGADGEAVHVAGNLKFDTPAPDPKPEVETRLQSLAAGRPMIVAGSTMDGEEDAVLQAFRHAGGGSRALLVLVPRHPERWDGVADLLASQGWTFRRRSGFAGPGTSNEEPVDVVLLDSLGELAALYRLAAAAFIGGTLVPTGGHNPLEAAVFGAPTVVGPSMFNFQEIADRFDQDRAWERAADAAGLGAIWRAWLDDPAAAKAVGDRALELLQRHRGATRRTLDLLAPFLDAAE